GGVELQEIALVVDAQRPHMVERLLVARGCVAERGTGGADANVVFLETESAKRLRREMASEVIVRAGFLEHRGLDAGHRNLQFQRRVARDDGLARRESRHVVAETRIFRS